MTSKFSIASQNTTHVTMSDLFKELNTTKYVCTDIESTTGVFYNDDTNLYVPIGKKELALQIQAVLIDYLTQKSEQLKGEQAEKRKAIKKMLTFIGTMSEAKSVAENFFGNTYKKRFGNQMDINPHVINFKNGLVDLRTGQFRLRSPEDKISKCLDYDYTPGYNKEAMIALKRCFRQIFNSDETLYRTNLAWLGYCLTGMTNEQYAMFIIGPSAQNGKSTCAKLYESTFPIYCKKLDRQTFNTDYTKKHKQFAMIAPPIRYIYIEEMDRKKMDREAFKDFVDGDKVGSNEVLFGTSADVLIQCKFNAVSNNMPHFGTDKGMERRGRIQYLTNKFIDEEKYNEAVDKKGLFIKDKNLLQTFSGTLYKMAIVHLLLPYAKQFYNRGLRMSETLRLDFEDLCQENDIMLAFIDTYYEKTDNDADRIHKDDFLKKYQTYTKLNNISWMVVMNDVKRLNLNYNSQARGGYRGAQGCLLCLKAKEDVDEHVVAVPIPRGRDATVLPIRDPRAEEMEAIRKLNMEASEIYQQGMNASLPSRPQSPAIIHDPEETANNIMDMMNQTPISIDNETITIDFE